MIRRRRQLRKSRLPLPTRRPHQSIHPHRRHQCRFVPPPCRIRQTTDHHSLPLRRYFRRHLRRLPIAFRLNRMMSRLRLRPQFPHLRLRCQTNRLRHRLQQQQSNLFRAILEPIRRLYRARG